MSVMLASRLEARASSAESASVCRCCRIAVSVALAVLLATVSSSNTASTAKATSGNNATPTMPTSRRLRNRRLGSRLRGSLSGPILKACLQIPPEPRMSPLAHRPLRFHYTGGAQCTLVCVAHFLPMLSPRRRWPGAIPPVAGLAVVLAGCTPSPPTKSPTSVPGGTAAQGGTLTVGVWQAPTTLLDDGITGSLPFADVIAAPVEEGLLWYRSSAATSTSTSEADYWTPDLRPAVPPVADGGVLTSGCADTKAAMCVTWHLREGVRWDDGSALTSHDVCDTFEFHWLANGALGKPSPTPLASTAGWNQVIKCTEMDSSTAVVDFKSQYGPYFSLGSGVAGILPAAGLDPLPPAGGNP